MFSEVLESAYQRYAAKRPVSERLHKDARSYLPSGTTRSVLDFDPFPFAVASAAGCRLTDVDGLEYLDYLGDYSVGLAGHNPQAVRQAISEILDEGWSFGTVAAQEAEVARMLCERFASLDLVRFTSSGTEANLVAIALALKWTRRQKVLVFDGGYHGGFLSFSRGRPSLNVPVDAVLCDYNDLDSVRDAFAQWPEQIGCILVEPMLGSGGRIQSAPGFLAGLRTICDEQGAVLLFDEVQTSRMSYGGAQELLGVRPDLTTMGKYLGGGFSFGVVGGAERVMSQIARGHQPSYDHSGTFNNNRFSMAAGAAMLRSVLTRDSVDALFERGEHLRGQADALLRTHGFQATGWGSLIGIHPTDIRVARAGDLAGVDRRPIELLFHELLDRGIYIGKSGFVTLSLPQTHETDTQFLTVLDSAVQVVARACR